MLNNNRCDATEHAADWKNDPVEPPELQDEPENEIDDCGSDHDDEANFAEFVLVGFGGLGISAVIFGDVIFFFLNASIDQHRRANSNKEHQNRYWNGTVVREEVVGLKGDENGDTNNDQSDARSDELAEFALRMINLGFSVEIGQFGMIFFESFHADATGDKKWGANGHEKQERGNGNVIIRIAKIEQSEESNQGCAGDFTTNQALRMGKLGAT